MSSQPQSHALLHTLPVIGFIVSEWQVWREEKTQPHHRLAPLSVNASDLPLYPLDMWPLLVVPLGTLDEAGVPYNAANKRRSAGYHPTTIAEYALAHWNAYLATQDEKHKQAFMTQARWLMAHQSRLADGASTWPIPFPWHDYGAPPQFLSAMTQGLGISVLLRAYRLTGEEAFLAVVRCAIRTFERDIRDGGVSTAIGEDGIFFEEVAVYPAGHILNGYLFALFGLYDYVALTGDAHIDELIQRSLATLHTLVDEYDAGYWSYYDLLYKRLAPCLYHALHITMLEALARYSGCEHCAALAARWQGYQESRGWQWRYFIASRIARYQRGFRRKFLGSLTGEANRGCTDLPSYNSVMARDLTSSST